MVDRTRLGAGRTSGVGLRVIGGRASRSEELAVPDEPVEVVPTDLLLQVTRLLVVERAAVQDAALLELGCMTEPRHKQSLELGVG